MFHNRTLKFFAILIFLPLVTIAASNQTAPYYFVADSVTYLSKTHKLTYTGHVKVDQGKTHLTGNKLDLYLTSNNKVIKMIDIGKPATYTTTQKNHPGTIYAKADKITFDQRKDVVYLDGHAFVKQNHNLIHAGHITYDRKHGVIHTHGSKHEATTHIVVIPTVHAPKHS